MQRKEKTMKNEHQKGETTTELIDAPKRPSIEIDIERYQSFFDESGLTDTQKEEFLRALWTIIVSFVDLGFGVHPVQKVCGQNDAAAQAIRTAAQDALESKDQSNIDQFELAACACELGQERTSP